MSPSSTDKIALFIDGVNLYATAKALGFDIDYKRLLKEFQSRGTLLKAFYYTAIIKDQEYSSIRPLIDWLDHNGYTVVTKATKLRRSEAVYEADVQRRRTVHPHRAATLPRSRPRFRQGISSRALRVTRHR
ncbi:uncharacterized LabA/DUF88 family protein [Bradyrhizobium sp. F1.2.2]